MRLSECAEPLAYDTAFWLTGFEEPDGIALDELGAISVELCGKLRTMAIIGLLVKGDSDRFLHNLVRSGRVRETYLSRLKQAGHLDCHHLASARTEGLLDAVAAGDITLAQRIAWLSPRQWERDREYEDDYCYAQILHRLLHGVQAAGAYQPLIERFEAALQGQASPRLDVARALVARAQPEFDAAFDSLLQLRRKEVQADIASAKIEEPQMLAEREVFVEGLALLRLALLQGLQTEDEYLYCPASARVPMRAPLPTPPQA
jgi:Immunity protein 49